MQRWSSSARGGAPTPAPASPVARPHPLRRWSGAPLSKATDKMRLLHCNDARGGAPAWVPRGRAPGRGLRRFMGASARPRVRARCGGSVATGGLGKGRDGPRRASRCGEGERSWAAWCSAEAAGDEFDGQLFCLIGDGLWSREQDAAVLLGTGSERGSCEPGGFESRAGAENALCVARVRSKMCVLGEWMRIE